MSSAERCTVAIVGAGGMAREHARAFQDVPGVTVAGIHSRTRSRAEALAADLGINAVCDSIDELYERTRADLVVVAVPELAASQVSHACFTYPWTALLEKPAGYNTHDAAVIRDSARAAGRRAFVALNRRSYGSTLTALAALRVDTGPRFIRVLDQQDQSIAIADGQPPEVVANWMYANSIHTIDYLRIFGRGPVQTVEPVLPWDPLRPGVVVARVEFETGDVGLYEGVWNGPGPWAVQVTTPSQLWELRPLERAGVQYRGERRLQAVEPDPADEAFKPGFRRQAEAAVLAALGLPSDCPTIDDALETMHLIRAIFGLPA
jgi:predicted dehydrogenase